MESRRRSFFFLVFGRREAKEQPAVRRPNSKETQQRQRLCFLGFSRRGKEQPADRRPSRSDHVFLLLFGVGREKQQ